MAATKNVIAGSPSAADTLELGTSGGIVQIGAGVKFKNANIGAITGSSTDSQAGGTLLAYDINVCTSTNDGHAVTLPVPTGGESILMHIATGAYALKVYPHSGGNINGGTSNAAVTVKEGLPQRFTALSTTTWSWDGTANS